MREAWTKGLIPNAEYFDLMNRIEKENQPRENEIVVLKRPNKELIEDLEDSINPVRPKLEDAYASLIVDKVMSAAAVISKKKNSTSPSLDRMCSSIIKLQS